MSDLTLRLRPICPEWIFGTGPADALCPTCGCLHGADKDDPTWRERERRLQDAALRKLAKS